MKNNIERRPMPIEYIDINTKACQTARRDGVRTEVDEILPDRLPSELLASYQTGLVSIGKLSLGEASGIAKRLARKYKNVGKDRRQQILNGIISSCSALEKHNLANEQNVGLGGGTPSHVLEPGMVIFKK